MSNKFVCSLMASKANEQDKNFVGFVDKFLKNIGIEENDRKEVINKLNISENEMKAIYDFVFESVYDILSREASLRLFKNDECNVLLKGKRTKERYYDNSVLHEVSKDKKYTRIAPFLKIICRSVAPSEKREYCSKNK